METKKRFNHWLPKRIGYAAIVIYPYMLFAANEEHVDGPLMRHELEHVKQVKETGWLRFYTSYLLYFFAGLIRFKDSGKAYAEIPYEVEAVNAENP